MPSINKHGISSTHDVLQNHYVHSICLLLSRYEVYTAHLIVIINVLSQDLPGHARYILLPPNTAKYQTGMVCLDQYSQFGKLMQKGLDEYI